MCGAATRVHILSHCLEPLPALAVPQSHVGTVGPPQPVLSFRLEAVPEMNYDPLTTPPR